MKRYETPSKGCLALCRIMASNGDYRSVIAYGEPGYPGIVEYGDDESIDCIVIDEDDRYTGEWREEGDEDFARWASEHSLPVWALELYAEWLDSEYADCGQIADDARRWAQRHMMGGES